MPPVRLACLAAAQCGRRGISGAIYTVPSYFCFVEGVLARCFASEVHGPSMVLDVGCV